MHISEPDRTKVLRTNMKKQREDNTVSVVQRAIRHYGVKVTSNSVRETLKSSPYYPSFRSICDAFREWKIEHYPLKYTREEMLELNSPYITHFNEGGGRIAFVSGYENGNVVYYDSFETKKQISWDEYSKNSSGAIILLSPDQDSGEKDYGYKRPLELLNNLIIPSVIGFFLLLISTFLLKKVISSDLQIPWQTYILLLTKFSGIFFTALLILKENEINMPIAEKLCHINKKINCNSVLNDKAAIVFYPVGWADIGMIYFMGSLLVMVQDNLLAQNGFLVMASILSLPTVVLSIWYQGFILKKWCPFCIMVQILLVAEFILQASSLELIDFSIGSFTTFVVTFLGIGVLQVLITLYINELRSARHTNNKLYKFKKNPEIFSSLLSKQKRFDIKTTDKSFLFGKLDSDLQVTAFLSLNCSHCASAFARISDLLKSESDIRFNIILSGMNSKFLDTLSYYLKNGNEDEALNLLDRWYKSDHIARSRFQDEFCLLDVEEVSDELSTESRKLMKECEVTGTPAFFINGYKLPQQYEIDDIKYFSEIFSKKEVLT